MHTRDTFYITDTLKMVSLPPPTYQPRQHSEAFLGEDLELPSYTPPSHASPLFTNYHADSKNETSSSDIVPPPRVRRVSISLEEGRPARSADYPRLPVPARWANQRNRNRLYRAERARGPAGPKKPRSACSNLLRLMILLACVIAFCYFVKWVVSKF